MTAFIIGWELRGIIFIFVEEAERDEPPVDLVVGLGRHLFDPTGGDPGKGADGIPEELDVVVVAHVAMSFCIRIGTVDGSVAAADPATPADRPWDGNM